MRSFLYVMFWFCLGFVLTMSLGCATIQRVKTNVCFDRADVKCNVEYALEY
jgi:hypothetical protein